MKNYTVFFLITFLISSTLAACNLPARQSSNAIDVKLVATNVELTLMALASPTPGEQTATPEPSTPTATKIPQKTATKTPTITPTYSTPILTFDNNVNCRKGPGLSFPIVVLIKEGQNVEVISSTDKYWVVKVPKVDENCWLPIEFATPQGSVWTVPTIAAPDQPTETPPIAPTWMKWNYYCKFSDTSTTLTMEMEWSDRNSNESGFRILRNKEVVAELSADSTTYTDSVNLDNSQTFDYVIEVFRGNSKSQSSIVNASCQ